MATCLFCGREEPLAVFLAKNKIVISHGETSSGVHTKFSVETHPGICDHCVLQALESLTNQVRENAERNDDISHFLEFLEIAKSHLTKKKKKS